MNRKQNVYYVDLYTLSKSFFSDLRQILIFEIIEKLKRKQNKGKNIKKKKQKNFFSIHQFWIFINIRQINPLLIVVFYTVKMNNKYHL